MSQKRKFYTVVESSFRYGELNNTKQKHYRKERTANEAFKKLKTEYSDALYYEFEKESETSFSANDLQEKWSYYVSLITNEFED